MEKSELISIIKEVREKSPKKKFSQTFDLIINLKEFDPKKNKVDVPLVFPKGKAKKNRLCGFVDKELAEQAKKFLDFTIQKSEFIEWEGNKKKQKALAKQYDLFIAQATIMQDIAKTFGKVLGPTGKMPDPKLGCIVQPAANLEPLVPKLKNTLKLVTKNESSIKTAVGSESMKDEDIAENILAVYDLLIKNLPQEKQNIKAIILKLTMGPTFVHDQNFKRKNEKQ